jgi:hypothetical protein
MLLDHLDRDSALDFDTRSSLLNTLSDTVLRQPSLANNLIERVLRDAGEPDSQSDGLHAALSAVLDSARMAQENGLQRGDTLVATLLEALETATAEGRLKRAHRLFLARVWSAAGFAVPTSLALTDGVCQRSCRVHLFQAALSWRSFAAE